MFTKDEIKGQVVATALNGSAGFFTCSTFFLEGGSKVVGTWTKSGEDDALDVSLIERISTMGEYALVLNEEEAAAAAEEEARKKSIQVVVKSLKDTEEEFKGAVMFTYSFQGSIPKKKAFTKAENDFLQNASKDVLSLDSSDPQKVNKKNVSGQKTLWRSAEYDAIDTLKTQRGQEFSRFGIPFPASRGITVVKVECVPEINKLVEKTKGDLANLVEQLIEVYPEQIKPEVVGLGPLYNPRDYKAVASLRSLFKFKHAWLSFRAPEEMISEIGESYFNAARDNAASLWEEAKEIGISMLRGEVSDMVNALVDSLTPNKDGDKKKFYATRITDMEEFFSVFERRNIAGDKQLSEQIAKMRKITSGIDLKAMSKDDDLRARVKRQMQEVKDNLKGMVVPAEERTISFED